jgi:ubiquinone/menaquinone biosynthesis C-methylase UbiE
MIWFWSNNSVSRIILIEVSAKVLDMSNSNFDPNEFKASQRQSWDSVARGWQKWWKTFENGAQKVSDRLIELADVESGQKVLDVATGIGEPAISAAKVAGKSGHITATDISSEMLAIAEERAKSMGLHEIMDFKQSDAESLELETNQAFNSIICRWGLMFLPNLDNALSNMLRLLVPGGRLAAAVWSEPSKVPLISMPISIARQELRAPLPNQGIPSPFGLADTEALKKSLEKAGFADIKSETIMVVFEFDSAEQYTEFNQDIVAPVRIMLANETEQRKQEIWDTVTNQAKQRFVDKATGRIKLANEAICIVGTRK